MKKIFSFLILFVILVLSQPYLIFAQPADQPKVESTPQGATDASLPVATDPKGDLAAPSEAVSADLSATQTTTESTPSSATQPTFSPTTESAEIPSGAIVVKAIEVVGNKTISIATILSKIKTRVGQEYLQSVISDDLKRLYNTGYFSDVRVDHQDYSGGFKVIISVEEKSLIEEITFSKTHYLNANVLKKKIKSQVGQFLDNKILKDDTDTIRDLYVKKGLTSAEVEVEKFIDDVTGKATLHFIVREGFRMRITRINIYGNDFYKDGKILTVIKTRSNWMLNSGYLKEEVLSEDMERIKSFYEQKGYIDATSEYTIEPKNKGRIEINIQISEGKRYSVGTVALNGNSILSSKEILKVMESIKEGGIFSREKLSVDLASIRTLYFDRGYIFADVKEATSMDPDTGKVAVKVDIQEGSLAYVEKVKIQGNARTRDIVIRRELKLYPGDRFDGEKLRRSKERLNNLGYFEDVSYDIEDTDTPDRKNLLVQVKEAKTGTFSFGGGFSTVDQLVGFVEIEQRNFDFTNWPTFTGGGQNLSLRAETGSTRNNVRLGFTEPWIFDHPVSGGFDAYVSERNRERDVGYAYDEKRAGGDIRLGRQFTDYNSGTVSYRNERVTISNLEQGVSADLAAEAGKNTISGLGFTLTRDTRDSFFNPSKGFYLNGGLDIVGGLLSGDKDFYRVTQTVNYYIPLNFKSVLQLSARAGFADAYGDSTKVPIFERFFAGGARTIRGYNERKVGPLDPVNSDPIGGEAMFVGNIEYTIPIVEFIKLAGFFDTGNVWSDVGDFGSGEFKSGAGLGLRVKTPVGPINLDYGYPFNEEPGETDKSGKFYFSVSRGF